MTVVTLNTRLRAIPGNGGSGGYDRDPIAFDDGELRLIHGGLGQVVEGLDGIDRKGRGQTAVPNVDPGGTVFVHPTDFPATVFLLEREEGAKVHFVSDSDGCAGEDAHGEGQSIALGPYPLLKTFAEDGTKGEIGISAFDLFEEASHEEQEAFRGSVITGTISVPPVDQDFSDPSESAGEFLSTAVSVEEGEDIHANNWIKSQPLVIKIGLAETSEMMVDGQERIN